MNKPTKKKRDDYNYNECCDYLEEKYGYCERDYGKRFKPVYNPENPYLDFWHWVCGRYEIHNGCVIGFEKSEIEYIEEPWVKEIYSRYIEEFADEDGELSLWVSW